MARAFTLLHKLGEGAYGAVHLAEVRGDEGFVQTVAVKWLHARWSADPELAGRLRDEARLMGLLNHDHIVRVHGLTRLEDRLAVLMEPVDGADLSKVGKTAVPGRAALEVTAAVADALDAAWRHIPAGASGPLRVVHRDIKPSNIMVTKRGGVKVMDFGVARATFDAREADTRSQQFGTARYMAPERWLEGVAEAPSDVFSLGVTLWELLTGSALERPRLSRAGFHEDVDSAIARLDRSDPASELVKAMLAFNPAERPSAEEVVQRCHAAVHDVEGPGLRDWARDWVPRHQRRHAEESSSAVIREDAGGATFDSSTAQVPPTLRADPLAAITETASLASPTATASITPLASFTGSAELTSVDQATLLASRRRGVLLGVASSIGLLGLLGAGWVVATGSAVESPPQLADDTDADTDVSEPDTDTDTDPATSEVSPEPEPPPLRAAPLSAKLTPAKATNTRLRTKPGRPLPAPRDTEVPEAEAAAVIAVPVPQTFVTFMPTSDDLSITGPDGPIPAHRAVPLPRTVVPIQIAQGDNRFTCTLLVGPSPLTFRVDGVAEKCTLAQ